MAYLRIIVTLALLSTTLSACGPAYYDKLDRNDHWTRADNGSDPRPGDNPGAHNHR